MRRRVLCPESTPRSPAGGASSAVSSVHALTSRSATPTVAARSTETEAPGRRPNIVLIVLDDLDSTVVTQLPEFQDLVTDHGAPSQLLRDNPLCAPSRASLLRGQYAHNHTLTNTVPDGGFLAFHRLGREESTIATWLHDAGYRTALIGKYLNGFPRVLVAICPAGLGRVVRGHEQAIVVLRVHPQREQYGGRLWRRPHGLRD